MKTRLTCAGLLITLLSGCATILNDDTQPINVTASGNKEVTGTLDGQEFKTPAVVNVTRENKTKVVAVSTEGCAKETSLQPSVDSKFFINILSGGLFGSSTDLGSGEMWRYSESVVIQCQ
jgi:hypothetical protein